MRRFFIEPDQLDSAGAVIEGTDAHHIRTVLRSKPGDEIFLFDGRGTDYRSRILEVTTHGIYLQVLDQFPSAAESPIHITIGQALIRTQKMDRFVRQFTELGGKTFVPFWTKRSTVKPDADRCQRKRHRWEKIAAESLKQCGRSRVPDIQPVRSFQDMLSCCGNHDLHLIFHNNRDACPLAYPAENRKSPRRILALVGPEGGFTAEEVDLAKEKGFTVCHMGPRLLKSDTAGVAALTLIQHRFGDLANSKIA